MKNIRILVAKVCEVSIISHASILQPGTRGKGIGSEPKVAVNYDVSNAGTAEYFLRDR